MPRARQSFTVPVTSGQYAPEVLYLNATNLSATDGDPVADLALLIEALPATCAIEVDLLKPGGSMATAGDWFTTAKSFTATGLATLLSLAAWAGVRVRAKSGGTAGTATVDASWSTWK